MAAKSKKDEALKFLDDLDSLEPPPPPASGAPGQASRPPAGEEEVYAFIDEITQKSSEPPRSVPTHIERPLSRSGTPTLRKGTERVKIGQAPSPLLPHANISGSATPTIARSDSRGSVRSTNAPTPASETPVQAPAGAGGSGGGWGGWGSVWNSASAAIQQARTVVDEQVRNLPKNEQARKWGEGVLEYAKNAQLDKLGQDFKRVGLSTLTDLLNVVAPPISEHEVIQVWLSHDMKGYDGVETLVYRAMARIMEQVEGGDLVVNRGDESRPKDSNGKRDLAIVEGLDAAIKLAQANLDEIIKRNAQPLQSTSTAQNPTTYSYVYIRIQPFTTPLTLPTTSSSASPSETGDPSQSTLQFLLYMSDPSHNLSHSTVTQAIPAKWVDLWDKYDWVEDLVVEAIRVGVEVIGQEYIVARMGWDKESTSIEEPADGQELTVPPTVSITPATPAA